MIPSPTDYEKVKPSSLNSRRPVTGMSRNAMTAARSWRKMESAKMDIASIFNPY